MTPEIVSEWIILKKYQFLDPNGNVVTTDSYMYRYLSLSFGFRTWFCVTDGRVRTRMNLPVMPFWDVSQFFLPTGLGFKLLQTFRTDYKGLGKLHGEICSNLVLGPSSTTSSSFPHVLLPHCAFGSYLPIILSCLALWRQIQNVFCKTSESCRTVMFYRKMLENGVRIQCLCAFPRFGPILLSCARLRVHLASYIHRIF